VRDLDAALRDAHPAVLPELEHALPVGVPR